MWASLYTTADRKNALQLRYEISTGKYSIARKLNDSWGGYVNIN